MQPSPILIQSDFTIFGLTTSVVAFCVGEWDVVFLFLGADVLREDEADQQGKEIYLHVGLFIKRDIKRMFKFKS